ncbi:MAG: site-specific integrase, partial [Acidobacteria bacterium]
TARLREGASGKTINEEVGFLFRLMGGVGDVVRLKLKKDRKLKLPQREDCGRALTQEEEPRLLLEAQRAQSPFIFPGIMVALNTTMRDSEIRHLTLSQLDFFKQLITVGKSKTAAGSGRTIPMNTELLRTLAEYKNWYEDQVAKASPDHYVFPSARSRKYDPTKPLVTFKTAWINVRRRANVNVRFHDLRHTLITKLAESGAGDETIMAIVGHVSRRMLSRYAHIRTEAKRRALEATATKPTPPSTEQPTRDTIQ